MDITLDKNSATEASIKIKLTEADYRPGVDKKIKEYSKKVNIKGFRPGKVPSALIKKMYGKSILVEELNHLLSHSITDYIKDNKIKIIGDPLPNSEKSEDIDWDNQKEFEFEYEIGLVDDFTYNLSKKIVKYDITVDEKTINETIENIRKQYGSTINAESSEENDYLYGELSQVDGDIQRETVIALFEVDEKARKKFIGVKPGEEIKFDIRKTFKEDRVIGLVLDKKPEEAKEIKGDFLFKVTKIDRRVPAELNQEFFDQLFGKDAVKTEKEFKEKIAANLKENYNRESENYLNQQIREKLVAETEIELPDNFLKKWLKATNKSITDEQIEREFDEYVKDLKWSLIRNEIGEDHKIEVDNEQIVDRAKLMIKDYLGSSGMPIEQLEGSLDQFADNYLKAEDGKNYMNTYEQVKNEKTLEVIKAEMNITEKKISADEFQKLASN